MKNLNILLVIAVVLVVLWVIASVTRFIVGAMLNLLLVFAVILLILWAYRKIRS
jgi:hypothetical protein